MALCICRLSFSGDQGESSSDSERSDIGNKLQHKQSKSVKDLESAFLSTSRSTDAVSQVVYDDDALLREIDHVLDTTKSSFHPKKTSTQLKKARTRKETKSTAKKLPRRLPSAAVHLSRAKATKSESEGDDTVENLLAEDARHFKGLKNLLARQPRKVVVSDYQGTGTSDESDDEAVTVASTPRQFAKKSTGNMAGSAKEKVTKSRKSVVFATNNGSEKEEVHRNKRKMTTKTPSAAHEDIYTSFEVDDEVHVNVSKLCYA